MNEFDRFVKHGMRVRYYVRYADDFVFLSENKSFLESYVPEISNFLEDNLKLLLHPDKVFIKTLASGVDFLGWVHSPHHRVLRSATKRRVLASVGKNSKRDSVISYLGILKHGNAHDLSQDLLSLI